MSQKRIPILRVKWEDSCTEGDWATWQKHQERDSPVTTESIGYRIAKTNRCITLGQSMSALGLVSDTISIPRKAVTSVEILGYSASLQKHQGLKK